jgi:cysteine desulfurase
VLEALRSLEPVFNGDPEQALPHVVNLSFPGLDSEALMVALKDVVAISNGSACTSHSYQPSHVLKAMGLSDQIIQGAVRISWCHMTQGPDWTVVAARIRSLL